MHTTLFRRSRGRPRYRWKDSVERGLERRGMTLEQGTPQMIHASGYPVEEHRVLTDDGYILTVHRIPHGANDLPEIGRPAVLLHHGLLSSSADFIINDRDKALAYILADAGYDVWVANCRGNTYSRHHTTLDPNDSKFWHFSWDEIAYYDVPAEIDYILAITAQQQLYYVGYSMGTTVFFAMLSERPEYNEKVRVMAALAPVVYLQHVKGFSILNAIVSNQLDALLHLLGMWEVLPGRDAMDQWVLKMCGRPYSPRMDLCLHLICLITGPDRCEVNQEYMPLRLTHAPAGTSLHAINHYSQLVLSGLFTKYDYGPVFNYVHYGQKEPPAYNLGRVRVPVGIMHGPNDWLATPEDVQRLVRELPHVVLKRAITDPPYNHIDFIWGKSTDQSVGRHVIALFAEYPPLTAE